MKQQQHPLKIERELRGWSQAKVAEAVGTSVRTIPRWEQGLVLPQPFYRERLSALFEKSLQELGLVSSLELQQQQDASAVLVPQPAAFFLLDPAIPLVSRNEHRIVGRASLFQQLRQQLTEDTGRTAIALHGLPGVGKTTLAAMLVADPFVQECFPGGILWAGLGPAPNLHGVLAHWATLLGVPVMREEALLQALHLTIGHRRMLLVIDDAWTDQEALVLHMGGDRCVHLLTTRLPKVAFAFARNESLLIPELDLHTGIELLAHHVPSLVKESPEAIDELVRAVGGLPLALTLLGNYLATQALAGQPRRLHAALQRLQERPQRLHISMPVASSERPPALPLQASLSLHTAIALSTQMLDPEAYRVFCALSVFPAKPASFSEEAALAVTQGSLETLDTLWDMGLLDSSGPGRYMLHQTVREYAQQQQQDDDRQRRFVSYMVDYIKTHRHEYEALERELPSTEEAFEIAHTLQMHRELLSGLRDWTSFIKARGLYHMVEHYLWYGLQAANAGANVKGQAMILHSLAYVSLKLGDYPQAKEYAQQGLAVVYTLDEKLISSMLLQTLGHIADNEGDVTGAEAFYHEGLQLARPTQNISLLCSLFRSCGRVARLQGKLTQALRYHEDAIQLARQHQYSHELSTTLCNMGAVWHDQGNLVQAQCCFHEALQIAQQLGQREILCYLFNNLGDIELSRGEFVHATTYYLKGLEQARQIHHREILSVLLLSQGDGLLQQCKYIQAKQVLQESVDIARQIKRVEFLSAALCYLGKALGHTETYEQAAESFQESLALAHQCSAPLLVNMTLISWGEIQLAHGYLAAAHVHFQRVLACDEEQLAYLEEELVRAHNGLLQPAFHAKNVQKAREHEAESAEISTTVSGYTGQEVQKWLKTLFPRPQE